MKFEKIQEGDLPIQALIFGDAGTGKTTLAVNLAILLSQKNKKVLIIDTENAMRFFVKQFEAAGIEALACPKPSSIEEFKKLLILAIQQNPDTIIIDSMTTIFDMHVEKEVKGRNGWGTVKQYVRNNIMPLLLNTNINMLILGRESEKTVALGEGEAQTTYVMQTGLGVTYDFPFVIRMTMGTKGNQTQRTLTFRKDRTTLFNDTSIINPNISNLQAFVNIASKNEASHYNKCIGIILSGGDITPEDKKALTQKELAHLREFYKSLPKQGANTATEPPTQDAVNDAVDDNVDNNVDNNDNVDNNSKNSFLIEYETKC